MKTLFSGAALALAAAVAAGPAHAQNPFESAFTDQGEVWPANAEEVDYGALDELPDWRGMWLPAGRGGEWPDPPLIGEYKERYDAFRGASASTEVEPIEAPSNCTPPGMPTVMTQPYNIKFLFTPGQVTIIQEAYMQVRQIFTDGRPQADDPTPAFNGHSVGHWEGDTLVVETIGVEPTTRLMTPGVYHSEELTITERIRLDPENHDRLLVEFTFTDPQALSEPWTVTSAFQRRRDWEQIEFICAQNDLNPIGPDGQTLFINAMEND